MYDVGMGLYGFWKESTGCIIKTLVRRPACSRLEESNERFEPPPGTGLQNRATRLHYLRKRDPWKAELDNGDY